MTPLAFPAMGLLESSERGGSREFDRQSSEARFCSVIDAAYLEICLLDPLLRLFSPCRQLRHRCLPLMELKPLMPLLLYVFPIKLLQSCIVSCLIDYRRLLLLQNPAIISFMLRSSRPLLFAFQKDKIATSNKKDQGHDAEG